MRLSTAVFNDRQSTLHVLRISFAMFFAYMTIGLSLTVVPLYVHNILGYSDTLVGLVMGCQFVATLLTRGIAGRNADERGAKQVMHMGLAVSTLSALMLLVADRVAHFPFLTLFFLFAARILLGISESQILTGNLAWGLGLSGDKKGGRVMSWNGIATYGALAAGAPFGLYLFHYYGFWAIGLCTVMLPVIAFTLNAAVPAVIPSHGVRLPLWSVVGKIWRPGLALALQGIGFAVLGTFVSLHFNQQHWANAGLALTAFGAMFIAVRLIFSHFPDRFGGKTVAIFSLLTESLGLLTLGTASTQMLALIGAGMTGAGCSLIFPSLGVIALRHSPPQTRGTALGGYAAFQDIAYGLSGPLAGLIAVAAGYPMVFLLAGGCSIAGVIFVALFIKNE